MLENIIPINEDINTNNTKYHNFNDSDLSCKIPLRFISFVIFVKNMSVKIGNIDLGDFPLLLAPMEDGDLHFTVRNMVLVCRIYSSTFRWIKVLRSIYILKTYDGAITLGETRI